VDTGKPSCRAPATVIGKSWVQCPSLRMVASSMAFSLGSRLSSTSVIKEATCSCALAATSARINISSLIWLGFLSVKTLIIDAAGMSPTSGSMGPRTALLSMTIWSAARAMSVSATHRVVRYEDGDFSFVFDQGFGDLLGRKHQAARGM